MCGSRQYWWRPGFALWLCIGCVIPADRRLGLEIVELAWTADEWSAWERANPQEVTAAVQRARENFVRRADHDPLGIVERANRPATLPKGAEDPGGIREGGAVRGDALH